MKIIPIIVLFIFLFIEITTVANAQSYRNMGKSSKFEPNSKYALLIIGIKEDAATEKEENKEMTTLNFYEINPTTGEVLWKGGRYLAATDTRHRKTLHKPALGYNVIRIPPGNFALTSIYSSRQDGDKTPVERCLNVGAYSFQVDAGKIYYFGDLELKYKGNYIQKMEIKSNLHHSVEVLKLFPKIKGEPVPLNLSPFTYKLRKFRSHDGC